MTPFEFVSQYHNLTVADPKAGLAFSANIWMYVSGSTGGKAMRTAEYNSVMSLVAKAVGVGGPSLVPNTFYLKDNPLADPSEPFYKQGIRRAFAGRGSPDEIRDAVRLAWILKKCSPYSAPQYAQGWFGQDCNSFVGNYQGISPNVSIRAYARGYDADPGEEIPGATNDVYLAAPRLPLPVITKPEQIKCGDVIITYDGKFCHVALVQSITILASSSKPKALLSIAEWGEAGGMETHAKPSHQVDLEIGMTCHGMNKTKVIGFYKGSKIRFFLDASPLYDLPSRGFHVCGQEGM